MRRMVSGPILQVPNENNKVYCRQLVSDSTIIENVEPGYYVFRLTQTNPSYYRWNDCYFALEDVGIYASHQGWDEDDNDISIYLSYDPDIKTINLSLYSFNISPTYSNYHIDIFKIA